MAIFPSSSNKSLYNAVLSLCILCFSLILYLNSKSAISAICSPVQTPSSILKNRGRLHVEKPSPSLQCCNGLECLKHDKGRYAVLTTLRTDSYLPYISRLSCSLKKSNPDTKLIVASVRGDLSASTVKAVEELGDHIEIVFWDEFKFPNNLKARFSYNWFKVRAWSMSNYDALLMVDSDVIIVDDVKHLFSLPTHIATVLDEDKTSSRYSSLGTMQGGVVFLRPCPKVTEHMIALLNENEALRFTENHAEQDFFDWYFRFERLILPTRYNSIRHLLDRNLLTRSGEKPVIVHYTRKIVDPKYWPYLDSSNCTDII